MVQSTLAYLRRRWTLTVSSALLPSEHLEGSYLRFRVGSGGRFRTRELEAAPEGGGGGGGGSPTLEEASVRVCDYAGSTGRTRIQLKLTHLAYFHRGIKSLGLLIWV